MELILAWHHPTAPRWYPAARLWRDVDEYVLRYVEAIASPDVGTQATLPGMEDVHVEYRSQTLFPFFQNRLYNRRRSDWDRYRDWLGLAEDDIADPLIELGISGAVRATDSYQVVPVPQNDDGVYVARFFVHGTRYVQPPVEVVDCKEAFDGGHGERLRLQFDVQNPEDSYAVSLRTDAQKQIVGYVPRLLGRDMHRIVALVGAHAVSATLDQVSEDAPHNLRYRCTVSAPWPAGFVPFADPEFRPIETRSAVAFVA